MKLRISIKPKALAEREVGTSCRFFSENAAAFYKVGISNRVTPSDGTTNAVFLGETEFNDKKVWHPPFAMYEMIYKVRSDTPTYDLPEDLPGMLHVDREKLEKLIDDGTVKDGSLIVQRIVGTPYLSGYVIPDAKAIVHDLNANIIDIENWQAVSPHLFYNAIDSQKDFFLVTDESCIEAAMDRDAQE